MPESSKGLADGEPVRPAEDDTAGQGVAVAGGNAVADGEIARPRRRRTPWTPAREACFLEVLATSSNVAEATRTSGLSETSIYRRRHSSPAFRAAWDDALGEGYVRLEAMMLQRGLCGVEKDVWHGGKIVGKMREYSDRLGLALLTRHRPTVRGERAASPLAESGDGLRARYTAELAEMNRRMGGDG
jgi:hypothetical protein